MESEDGREAKESRGSKYGISELDGDYVLPNTVFHDIYDHIQPPPVIKPQSALNERETMETEVISECRSLCRTCDKVSIGNANARGFSL